MTIDCSQDLRHFEEKSEKFEKFQKIQNSLVLVTCLKILENNIPEIVAAKTILMVNLTNFTQKQLRT